MSEGIKAGESVTVDKGMPSEHSGTVVASFFVSTYVGKVRAGVARYYVVALDTGFWSEDRKTFVMWLNAHSDNVVAK